MNTLWVKGMPGLSIILSFATITTPALGQEVAVVPRHPEFRVKDGDWSDLNTIEQRAFHLLTAPKTRDEMLDTRRSAIARIDQVVDTIPTASIMVPQPVNPTDALTDPAGTLQKFLSQKPPAPEPIQPLAFFKIPDMSPGVKLDMWEF